MPPVCTESTNLESQELVRLYSELGRLNAAKDQAMAAYIAYVHAQRALTGEELQKAMRRTAEAEQAFEQANARAQVTEKALAACKRALREASASRSFVQRTCLSRPPLDAKRVIPPSK